MSEIVVRDALGRPLNIGDRLVVTNGEPPVYAIVDIKPMVHPKAPKGAVVVVLQNTFTLPVKDGSVLPDFLRVQTAAEQGIGGTEEKKPDDLEGQPEKATLVKLT